MERIQKVKIEAGALVEVLAYEEHRRGRNWLATIAEDPRAPGGLRREFWERGRGRFYYIIPRKLGIPCAVEFGADYYTGSGGKCPRRVYAVLVSISETEAVFEVYGTAQEGIQRAEELRREQQGDKILKMEVRS
jgi:hypothetical protein